MKKGQTSPQWCLSWQGGFFFLAPWWECVFHYLAGSLFTNAVSLFSRQFVPVEKKKKKKKKVYYVNAVFLWEHWDVSQFL